MIDDLIKTAGSGAEALKQFGTVAEMLLKPMATRALAEAEADAKMILARVDIAADTLRTAARQRAELDEVRHYVNLVAALKDAQAVIEDRASRGLLPEKAATSESDPDWFHKWANYAKETSDQDIRALWAKVLAGEIIRPGKFSLRLLHTLNLLRKEDATRFYTFCNYVWRDQKGGRFLLYDDNSLPRLKALFDGREPWLSDFHELGLTVVMGILGNLYPKESGLLCYGGVAYSFFDWKLPQGAHSPVLISLTALGRELMDLCDPQPDYEYLSLVGYGMFGAHQPPPSPWPWPDVPQAT